MTPGTDTGQPKQEFVETVITCKGNYYDPDFPTELALFNKRLNSLLEAPSDGVVIKKVEPWNSVKVTVNIPQEAAVKLKQLASQNNGEALTRLGIMAVQFEGDRVISLTLSSSKPTTAETASTSKIPEPTLPNNSPLLNQLFQNAAGLNAGLAHGAGTSDLIRSRFSQRPNNALPPSQPTTHPPPSKPKIEKKPRRPRAKSPTQNNKRNKNKSPVLPSQIVQDIVTPPVPHPALKDTGKNSLDELMTHTSKQLSYDERLENLKRQSQASLASVTKKPSPLTHPGLIMDKTLPAPGFYQSQSQTTSTMDIINTGSRFPESSGLSQLSSNVIPSTSHSSINPAYNSAARSSTYSSVPVVEKSTFQHPASIRAHATRPTGFISPTSDSNNVNTQPANTSQYNTTDSNHTAMKLEHNDSSPSVIRSSVSSQFSKNTGDRLPNTSLSPHAQVQMSSELKQETHPHDVMKNSSQTHKQTYHAETPTVTNKVRTPERQAAFNERPSSSQSETSHVGHISVICRPRSSSFTQPRRVSPDTQPVPVRDTVVRVASTTPPEGVRQAILPTDHSAQSVSSKRRIENRPGNSFSSDQPSITRSHTSLQESVSNLKDHKKRQGDTVISSNTNISSTSVSPTSTTVDSSQPAQVAVVSALVHTSAVIKPQTTQRATISPPSVASRVTLSSQSEVISPAIQTGICSPPIQPTTDPLSAQTTVVSPSAPVTSPSQASPLVSGIKLTADDHHEAGENGSSTSTDSGVVPGSPKSDICPTPPHSGEFQYGCKADASLAENNPVEHSYPVSSGTIQQQQPNEPSVPTSDHLIRTITDKTEGDNSSMTANVHKNIDDIIINVTKKNITPADPHVLHNFSNFTTGKASEVLLAAATAASSKQNLMKSEMSSLTIPRTKEPVIGQTSVINTNPRHSPVGHSVAQIVRSSPINESSKYVMLESLHRSVQQERAVIRPVVIPRTEIKPSQYIIHTNTPRDSTQNRSSKHPTVPLLTMNQSKLVKDSQRANTKVISMNDSLRPTVITNPDTRTVKHTIKPPHLPQLSRPDTLTNQLTYKPQLIHTSVHKPNIHTAPGLPAYAGSVQTSNIVTEHAQSLLRSTLAHTTNKTQPKSQQETVVYTTKNTNLLKTDTAESTVSTVHTVKPDLQVPILPPSLDKSGSYHETGQTPVSLTVTESKTVVDNMAKTHPINGIIFKNSDQVGDDMLAYEEQSDALIQNSTRVDDSKLVTEEKQGTVNEASEKLEINGLVEEGKNGNSHEQLVTSIQPQISPSLDKSAAAEEITNAALTILTGGSSDSLETLFEKTQPLISPGQRKSVRNKTVKSPPTLLEDQAQTNAPVQSANTAGKAGRKRKVPPSEEPDVKLPKSDPVTQLPPVKQPATPRKPARKLTAVVPETLQVEESCENLDASSRREKRSTRSSGLSADLQSLPTVYRDRKRSKR